MTAAASPAPVARAFLSPRELADLLRSAFRDDLRRPWREHAPPLVGALLLVGVDMAFCALARARFRPVGLAGEALAANGLYLLRLVFAALYVGAHCRRAPGRLEAFGLRPAALAADAAWGMRAVLTGAALHAVAGLLAVPAYLLAVGPLPPPPSELVAYFGLDAPDVPRLASEAAAGLVMAPLAEEAVYRAVLLPPLLLAFRPWVAVGLNAVVFAALHAGPYGFGWFVPSQLLGGALMALAFYARRSVVPAVLVHAFGNLLLAASGALYVALPRVWPGLFA